MRQRPTIRPYRAQDRDAVRQICFQTGFMGSPIADQYRDFESFADIFSAHYTDVEPEHAVVAELDGQVVGYLLTCFDTKRAINPLGIALKHVFLRGVCFRPGTARFYFRALGDALTSMTQEQRPHVDLDRYPAHTHCNFLPGVRHGGLGTQMFYELFDRLKLEGYPGMHAEVMAENANCMTWVETKLGYRRHGRPYPALGVRGVNGERLRVQMILRELDDWVPGAWKHAAETQQSLAAPPRRPKLAAR